MRWSCTTGLLVLCISSLAQNIGYDYDESGNRVLRKPIIFIPPPDGQSKIDNKNDEALYRDSIGGYTFTLYPNPAKEYVTVEADKNLAGEKFTVELYNAAGQLLVRKVTSELTTTIDFLDRLKGIYLLRIYAGGVFREWRVVKQ